MNQAQVIKSLVEKSWSDSQFKADFITNPVATIEEVVGRKINIPEGKKIVVVDQSNVNTYYLNLSHHVHNLDLSNKELTDEQLEVVAGGAPSPKCNENGSTIFYEEPDFPNEANGGNTH